MLEMIDNFKAQKALLDLCNDQQEEKMQFENKLIKNEVIDMADMVEELNAKIQDQNQKIDQQMDLIIKILQ